MTKVQALYRLMRSGRWVPMDAMARAGGWRYGARLDDLRRKGIDHEAKKVNGKWMYRLVWGKR